MEEEWRPVVGYEGFYEVSNIGRVRRVPGSVNTRTKPFLKLTPDKAGYPLFTICTNGIKRSGKVHRVVAAAFIGKCPEGWAVNHKDGVKHNNVVDNLEYMTISDNVKHAFAAGFNQRGERNGMAKMNDETVRKMRSMYPALSYRQISTVFGFSYNATRLAIQGKSWRHVA